MPLKIRLGKRSGKYKVSESDPIYANVDHVRYHSPLIENNYNNLSAHLQHHPLLHRLEPGSTMVQFHPLTPARLLHQAFHMQHHHPAILSHLTTSPAQIHHQIHNNQGNNHVHHQMHHQMPNQSVNLNCHHPLSPIAHHQQTNSLQQNHHQPSINHEQHHYQLSRLQSHQQSPSLPMHHDVLQSNGQVPSLEVKNGNPVNHQESQSQSDVYAIANRHQLHRPSSSVQLMHQQLSTVRQQQHHQSALQLSQQSTLVQSTNSVHHPSNVQLNQQSSNEQIYRPQTSSTSIVQVSEPPPPLLDYEERLKLLPPYRPPPAYETFVREMYGINVDGSQCETNQNNNNDGNQNQLIQSDENLSNGVEPPLFERATESGSSTESTTRRHGPTRWL